MHEPHPGAAAHLEPNDGVADEGQLRWWGGEEEEGQMWGVRGLQGELQKTLLNVTD